MRTEETAEVARVMEDYIRGTRDGDGEVLRRIFHPDAMLAGWFGDDLLLRRPDGFIARAESLEGLPPTWISTAALDLFRDENIEYAQRLLNAGVATEFILYPGACHGFQMAPDASVSKQFARDHMEALGRALKSGA